MSLSITTIAPKTRLTTRAAVRVELGSVPTSDDALLDSLIDGATAGIQSWCNRTFAREAITELLPGYGDIHLQLARTPVISVSAVSVDSGVVTDYTIAEKDRGWLYRRGGWAWTAQSYGGLGAVGAWLDQGYPLARQEEPSISVAYVAGYILPEQNICDSATISADGGDNSFNDSAGKFPSLLKAGDILLTSGFGDEGNNGRFQVTGTPTASKVVVSGTLTTAAAGAAVDVEFQPPPDCRPFSDLQKAANEVVKAWWQGRKRDPQVFQEMVGSLMITYAQGTAGKPMALPPSVVGLLRPWVRAA